MDTTACQAQQRPAKLASIYFGKSKFSLDDILATKGKENALNALSKKEKPTIEKMGDWSAFFLLMKISAYNYSPPLLPVVVDNDKILLYLIFLINPYKEMNKRLEPQRLLSLLLVCCCFALPLYGQEYAIDGKLLDKEGKPLEFVTVELLDKDSAIAKAGITDEKGYFSLVAAAGAYVLNFTSIGKRIYRQSVELKENIHLGNITAGDAIQLEEVKVTARKKTIELKPDRLIFNVENSAAAERGDAADVLRVTPRVQMKEDAVEIIGKGVPSVMVDGRIVPLSGEDLVRYLKNIPSANIKRIEVITTPPAKYSAEGNAGMLNIVLKKAGNNTWNASVGGYYRQTTYPAGGGDLSYNLQYKKLTLQSSLSGYGGSVGGFINNGKYFPDQYWDSRTSMRQYAKGISPKIAIDYTLSDKFTTGMNYNLSLDQYQVEALNVDNVDNRDMARKDFLLHTNTNPTIKIGTHTLNYHLIFSPDTLGRKLSLDFDWFRFNQHNDQPFKTDSFPKEGQSIKTTLQSADNIGNNITENYSINLDMEHPTPWATLNYGGRLSFIQTNSDFNYYNTISGSSVLEPTRSNTYSYKENTQALYFSAQKSFAKKWNAKVGLRVEATQIEGYSATLNQSIPISYTQLFPTAYVSFSPTEKHSLSLNYGRRISRPFFQFLNPFRITLSPYSYIVGNPYLLPSFTHNMELGYSYKDLLITSLYIRHTEDGYNNTLNLDPQEKTVEIKPWNYLQTTSVGISQSANMGFFNNRLTINLSADVSYQVNSSSRSFTLQNLNGWQAYFTINMDYAFNKSRTILLNIYQSLSPSSVWALYQTTSRFNTYASVKFLLWDKRLTISLQGNDIFRADMSILTTYSNEIKSDVLEYHDAQYFQIRVAYKIGKSFKTYENKQKNKEEYRRLGG